MQKKSVTTAGLGALMLWASIGLARGQDTSQNAVPAPSQPPTVAPCSQAEFRQFDFWLGEWEVSSNGKAAGRNSIRSLHGGCALAEHWTSANGKFAGSSLNAWDVSRGVWHQTWVDSSGTLLLLEGGLVGQQMVLSSRSQGADGGASFQRISWTPNADGSVRQLWETSTDGVAWTVVFDGLYQRPGAGE